MEVVVWGGEFHKRNGKEGGGVQGANRLAGDLLCHAGEGAGRWECSGHIKGAWLTMTCSQGSSQSLTVVHS